jgi:hypothetical protein
MLFVCIFNYSTSIQAGILLGARDTLVNEKGKISILEELTV